MAEVRKVNNMREKDNENEDEEFTLTNDAQLASGSVVETSWEDEPIFNVMPPVKTFTGRTGELIELHEKLQKPRKPMLVSQCAVISGLGGVGKSELARKYAWEYYELYKHIIWINCEKKLDTLKSFQKLAEDLKILKPIPDGEENKSDPKGLEKDLQSILAKIYKRLSKSKTLFIFDNVDQFKDIKNLFPLNLTPADEKPAIIITSRNSDWDIGEEGEVDVILLDQFTPDEAASYVRKSLQINEEDKSCDFLISELIETLWFFPLALLQAVSFIKTKSSLRGENENNILTEAFTEYSKKLRDVEQKENLLKWKPKHDRYTQVTYTTWLITFENIRKIERNGDLAIFLVEIMSYLDPNHISLGMFMELVRDEERLQEAIDILAKYSIIRVRYCTASIHRLVQLVVRSTLKGSQREEKILRIALFLVYKYLHANHFMLYHLFTLWGYACNYTTLIGDYFCTTYDESNDHEPFIQVLYYHVKDGNVLLITKILDYLESKSDLWHKMCSKIFDKELFKCNHKYPSTVDAIHDKHVKNICLLHAEVYKALKTSKTEDLKEFLKSFDKSLKNSWFDGFTTLYKSVGSDNLDVVKILIENGADINYGNNDDDSENTMVSLADPPEIVEYLLEQGLDPNLYNRIIDYLADKQEVFENRSIGNWRPLHLAAKNDQLEIVKFLISKGVDVTAETNRGETACHIAVRKGSIRVVKYLIDNKLVDVNLRNGRNETLLHTAATHEHFDIVKYLLNATSFAHDNIGIAKSLHCAAKRDQLEIVKFLISKRVDVKAMTEDGETACHIAVASGSIRIVKYLIDNKLVKVNLRNGRNETLLHTAAAHEHLDIVKYLLSDETHVKADINGFDHWGSSPLLQAVAKGNIEIVRYLIQHEVSVGNVQNEMTLFGKLIYYASHWAENFIQDRFTLLGELKLSPLHLAAALNNFEIAKILVEESKADINMGLDTSASPLQVAKTFNSTKVRDFLLEKGADESIKDNSENIRYIFRSCSVGSRNVNYDKDNEIRFRILLNCSGSFKPCCGTSSIINFFFYHLASDIQHQCT